MCGIAGWVDYRLELMDQAAVIAAMTATMRRRGPDDEGIYMAPHILLGHRRLAVIDLSGGRQPMTSGEDDSTVAVSFSGEIYNFRELRAELATRGHRFRTVSDSEVVLHAYLEWGERCPEHFVGMFAVAAWDARRHSLVLIRDHTGIKPLYYQPTETGALFGSEPKAVLAHPQARARIDEDGMREILAFVRTPGHAFFQDIHEVKPGTTLRIDETGIHSRTYWSLMAADHTDDLDTTVDTIRGLLDDIVHRQLVADVPLSTLLSGGVDSSALTALAAASGDRLRSYTVDLEGSTDGFRPESTRQTPDAPYATMAARHIGVDHRTLRVGTRALADPALRLATVRARDLPVGANDQDTSLYLLFRAIRAESTVVLSGEGADEVFGGYTWFHDPRVLKAGTFPWHAITALRGRTGSADALLSPALRAELDVPGYQRESYRQALAEVPKPPGEPTRQARMRELCHLALTRCLQFHLDRKDRISMAVGLEVRVPFCDHRLVQYLYNVPWAMKTFDGREKSLLRSAVADLLPSAVLLRRKAHYPAPQDPAYGRLLCAQLSELLAGSEPPIAPLLDPAAARRAAAEPEIAAVNPARRDALENVLTLNTWLGAYPVELNLSSGAYP